MTQTLRADSNVLVTGATGLIGGEILRLLAAQPGTGTLWALIRGKNGSPPAERLRHRFQRSGDSTMPERVVEAVEGNVLGVNWDLDDDVWPDVQARVDIIVHNAADTSFAVRRDTSKTNVESVERLIDLARNCPRNPLIVYMSTASNVGDVTGQTLGEAAGCRPDNKHHNEYTHSKAVGETLLRNSGLPVLILRPTIVLSRGLPDPEFARQILWCVPLTRVFQALPLDPASRLDIVDVGFVAEATLRLLGMPDRKWDCYNISAGEGHAVTIGELGRIVDLFYKRRTRIELVPMDAWNRESLRKYVRGDTRKRVFRSLRHYLPFLNMNVVFDNARLQTELGNDFAPEPIANYFTDLVGLIRAKAALQEAALP